MIEEWGKRKKLTYLNTLISYDATFKIILFLLILFGLFYTNFDIGTLITMVLISITFLILASLIFYEVIYKKYLNWLKQISKYSEYQDILEHILTAGMIVHILWILIISLAIFNSYIPQSNLNSYSLSALLWMFPVHIGGIVVAPRWEKNLVKKTTSYLGLIGLLITFFISAISIDALPVIIQNIRFEWINQLFAFVFISSQS